MRVVMPPRLGRRCAGMDFEAGSVIPACGRTMRLLQHALLLRCPSYGNGPVLERWMNATRR